MVCAAGVERVGERAPREIVVDERRDRADLDDPEPRKQIFGPVFHQQRNHIAALDALREGPARILIARLIVFTVGIAAVLEIDRDVVGLLDCEALHDICRARRRVGAHAIDALQGAQNAGEKDVFAPDALKDTHAAALCWPVLVNLSDERA